MPLAISVTITEKENQAAMEALFGGALSRGPSFVDVGTFDNSKDDKGTPMAMIAAVHEFGAKIPMTDKMRGYLAAVLGIHLKKGTTTITIPERSFIRSAMENGQDKINDRLRQDLLAFVSGKATKRQVFARVGLLATSLIQKRIRTSKSWAQPLSDATIEAKTVRGKKGDTPLIDTGRMLASMTFRIQDEPAKPTKE